MSLDSPDQQAKKTKQISVFQTDSATNSLNDRQESPELMKPQNFNFAQQLKVNKDMVTKALMQSSIDSVDKEGAT